MSYRQHFLSILLLTCAYLPLRAADVPDPAPGPARTASPSHAPAAAAENLHHWQVVPADSRITFHGVSTLHDFDGTAAISAGTVDLTPGHEAGTVTVLATSMQTGNGSRDRTMQADHMESAKFPTIVFTLVRLERTAHGAIAHGTWAMHGVTQQVDLPVTLPPDPVPASAATPATTTHLTAEFTLDMTQWQIPVPSVLGFIRVKPQVTVAVTLALVPAPPVPAAAHP